MHSLNIHSCENRIQASVKSANSLPLPASNLQIIWGCQKSTFKGWALNLYRGSMNIYEKCPKCAFDLHWGVTTAGPLEFPHSMENSSVTNHSSVTAQI